MQDRHDKYILLEASLGQDDTSRNRTSILVSQGEILEELPTLTTETISLRKISQRSHTLSCSKSKVAKLTGSEVDLLMAVRNLKKRYSVYMERRQIEFSKTLKVDSKVLVQLEGNENQVPGIVKEIGPHERYQGLWFRVEITVRSHEYMDKLDYIYILSARLSGS